jgi:hypothetical protein
MSFKLWLIESSLRDLLKDVPQNPDHHAEGDVFRHTKMVRNSLEIAKRLLEKEQGIFPFSKINFDLSDKEEKILKISAWLHDIGKASATTVDGVHWKDAPSHTGKISAHQHDQSHHYEPMIDKLGSSWGAIISALTPDEIQDVYFCIDYHMSLGSGSFSKKVSSIILDQDGNYKNERRVKLLLYIITMDWAGRISGNKGGENGAIDAIKGFKNSANKLLEKNKIINSRKKVSIDDPKEFILSLKGRPVEIIKKAFQNKFNREMSEEEISSI